MEGIEKLNLIKNYAGQRITEGLDNKTLESFLTPQSSLAKAIDQAFDLHLKLKSEYDSILKMDEKKQIELVQESFLNFYQQETINPYVALSAYGPWIVTTCGAVIHDNGGYGMLGFGHQPEEIIASMADSTHVMANIMTPNLMQHKLGLLLDKEIGHTRTDSHQSLYEKYICLNSGSECVTIALRLSDILAKKNTDPGEVYEGRQIKLLSFQGGFHGRTDYPSQASDSCLSKYKKYLASFRDRDNLLTIEPNSIEQLESIFQQADEENWYIQALLIEPVMGEGNPGLALDPKFYKKARELTLKYNSFLIMDSIQSGFRANGCLSFLDYPGFQNVLPADCEIYSKALNAGQYPLSILALSARSNALYKRGLYGNTMTTNPRALAVACSVLNGVTPNVRKNIVERGREFLTKCEKLQEKFPQLIESCQGTGLLFCININPDLAQVVGKNGLELKLRQKGLGVIHGGKNALRFTPPFNISSKEVDLIISLVSQVLGETKP